MDTTNQRTLRGQFLTAILGITPTYAEHQDAPWRYAKTPQEVPGPQIRRFTILATPAEAESPDESVYGGGISFSYVMQVRTSYGQMLAVDDESSIY